MPVFDIYTDISLGISHSGEVTADGTGTVELTDEEVQQLIDLIRENGGETDVEKLELEEKYPDIYETLDEAYGDAARDAAFREWVIRGYERDYFDEPDDFMESIEEAGLFKFEPTAEQIEQYREDMGLEDGEEIDPDELDEYLEDDKWDAFYECVNKYYKSLDEDGKIAFIEKYYAEALEDWDSSDVDYVVEIPPAIIEMARKEE